MKKKKKYLRVIMVNNNIKSNITQCLKLSEVHIISKLAQENDKLDVSIQEVDELEYKFIFE